MPRRGSTQALQDELWGAYYRSIDLILVNVIWFVFSLPVVTAVPALGGLFYATNRMAHGGTADWRVFWEGFRRCFWLSWRWAAAAGGGALVLVMTLWFYDQAGPSWLRWVRPIVALLLAVWAELMLFAFPLLLEQADQRLSVALRNGGVLLLRCPLSVGAALLQIALVSLASVFVFPPAWIVISASLCAYLANKAVVAAIARLRPPPD